MRTVSLSLGRPTGARALALHVDRRGSRRRAALRDRLGMVVETLDTAPQQGLPTVALLRRLADVLGEPAADRIWLALAVISGRLPLQSEVEAAVRRARLDGPLAAVAPVLAAVDLTYPVERQPWPRVRVVTGEVLVDLHHTSHTALATGIQRVARQAAVRWQRDHAPRFVGWTHQLDALRQLTAVQESNALHGNAADDPELNFAAGEVIVPWKSTYLLPELLTEPERARGLLGMLRFSGGRAGMIGFDCVPLTSAETTADGMGGGYSMMLSALAHGDRIAAISESAAIEYRGWRTMLSGAGLAGPDVSAVSLPVEAVRPGDAALAEARDRLIAGGLPMVLCVGSHEPRKNHLAVLHAAELLWREDVPFSLMFVGGNAWSSEHFVHSQAAMQAAGRPVEAVRALSDQLLWAAYRLARCVIFPSMNEGFGLPVAESLASGTPVITSGFGSMREIAAHGGALLVDPRDDHSITEALRRMLTDDALHSELAAQARAVPTRTWEQYAAETWDYLTGSAQPAVGASREVEAIR